MADLLSQVRHTICRYDLLRDGMALVVGVSGGPDSLCLLHLLSRLAPEVGLRLHVAHLNHGLRGTEADADADFVAEFAAGVGLPCTVGRADVASLAREAGLSLEEAARQVRYRFLADVAADADADTIAVGHNADDQVETVLMHFLRGSGVAGLRGMLPKTPLGEFRLSRVLESGGAGEPEEETSWLIRPLLGTPRGIIEAYCAEHSLQPRFDRSNEDTTLYRNRLRHELLPILEGFNPRIREVLAHTAEVLTGDHEVLRTTVEAAWDRVIDPHPQPLSLRGGGANDDIHLDLLAWRALPLGMQRATIREAIHRLRASLRNINWEHVERAVWLARDGGTGQKATLAAGLELEIGYRSLRIGPEEAPASPLKRASLVQPGGFTLAPAAPAQVSSGGASGQAAYPVPQIDAPLLLAAPGETAIGHGWGIVMLPGHVDSLAADRGACTDPWVAVLDADALGSGLSLRPRQPGDRFQPQGLGGHSTKLNEFMINAKVPKDARAGWPLLCGVAGIAWVCGLRVAEWAIVQPETRAVWVARFISSMESE